jgi:HNH endonuclease
VEKGIWMLTIERLKSIINYDPQTGRMTWKAPLNNRRRAGDLVGCLDDDGYRHFGLDGKYYTVGRAAYFYMTGDWPNRIDHINRIRTDDRWINLRNVTPQNNSMNRNVSSRNVTSGVSGVCWHKGKGKWRVYITIDYRQTDIGTFDDLDKAVAFRRAAEIKHFGQFAPNWKKELGL